MDKKEKETMADWFFEKVQNYYKNTGKLMNEITAVMRAENDLEITLNEKDRKDCIDIWVGKYRVQLIEMGYEIKERFYEE